jgi:hypothetical protein
MSAHGAPIVAAVRPRCGRPFLIGVPVRITHPIEAYFQGDLKTNTAPLLVFTGLAISISNAYRTVVDVRYKPFSPTGRVLQSKNRRGETGD